MININMIYQHDVGEGRVMASYENVHVALNSLIVNNITKMNMDYH